MNSKTFILKLFRYIVPILFLFCSVAVVGQEERCDCFWLVFEDTTIQDISVIPKHNYEVYRTNIFKSGNKLFARIDVLSSGTDDGNVSTLPYPLLCIDGVPKMYIKCKNLFHSGDINETKVVFKSSGYTVVNASIIGGVVKIPYDAMFDYVLYVSLQPCETFESFLKKYENGVYKRYSPEETTQSNYEADGFNTLKEW